MDEMRIKSKFLKGMICKIVEKLVKKKTGQDIFLDLQDLDICLIEDRISVKLSAELNADKKILNEISDLI